MRHSYTGKNKEARLPLQETRLFALAVTGPFKADAPLASTPACPGHQRL